MSSTSSDEFFDAEDWDDFEVTDQEDDVFEDALTGDELNQGSPECLPSKSVDKHLENRSVTEQLPQKNGW
ncbi:MAG: hypothetical protein MI784_06015, partial [Cytophagales bacterium]|nr:hypothetical protein [Cytophagales bacterium]